MRTASAKLVSTTALLLVALVAGPAGAEDPLAPADALAGVEDEPQVTGSALPGRLLVGMSGRGSEVADEAVEGAVDALPGVEPGDVAVVDVVEGLGLAVVEVEPDVVEEVAAALADADGVEYVEPDAVVTATRLVPQDPLWRDQRGLAQVDFPALWATSLGSSSVTIAIVDSGVQRTHPDLAPAVVSGYDFVRRTTSTVDGNGHGTSSAGLVGARLNNGRGIAGGCPTCTLLDVRVLDDEGLGYVSDVAAGIDLAVAKGAHIINLSLGTASDTTTLRRAVTAAHEAGALLIASAGNAGLTAPSYPAAYAEVLAVAAYEEATTTLGRYSWSNHSSWVAVAAPGCNPSTDRDSGYRWFCGTSSAAPVVSGLAGLLRSIFPDATAAELSDALRHGSHDVSWVAHGRVDAQGSYDRLVSRAGTTALGPARQIDR